MQTIYYYRPENKEFLKTGEIEDRDTIPDNATAVPVPQAQQNVAYIFDTQAEAWGVVDDYRRYRLYSTDTGASYILEDLGAIPQGYTIEAPPDYAINYPTQYTWDGQQWVVNQQAIDDALAAGIRKTRNALLLETDFIVSADCPIKSDHLTDFAKYRQWLRDITGQHDFPQNVTYPIKPDYLKTAVLDSANTKATAILQGYNLAVNNPIP